MIFEFTLKPNSPYKNPLMMSFIHKQIKSLEEQAQYFYEHRLFRLEDLCDSIRGFYLDLISRHCKCCKARESVMDPIVENGLCRNCYRWKRYPGGLRC